GAVLRSHGPHTSPGSGPLAQIEQLSTQGQGVISTALGAGNPAFDARPTRSGYGLAGGGVVAQVARDRIRLSAGGGAVSLLWTGTDRPAAHRNRVWLGGATVSQWYAAGPLGIESGFTVAHPKRDAGGWTALSLRVVGSLYPRRSAGGVEFLTRAGRVALDYSGLTAVDATGRRLPVDVRLQNGRLVLQVFALGARYPVRIDPFIQQGKRLVGDCTGTCVGPNGTGENGEGGFGYAVALSANGNTALVGTPFENSDTGSAWIFTRAANGIWSQQ